MFPDDDGALTEHEKAGLRQWTLGHVDSYLRGSATRAEALSRMVDDARHMFDLQHRPREAIKAVVGDVVYSTDGIG